MQQATSDTISTRRSAARIAGAALLAGTLVELLGMAHHPSVHTPDVAAAVRQIIELGQLSAWVHGIIFTGMLCTAYGMLGLTSERGWSRSWVRAAVLTFGTGTLLMVGAGLVSGFILPGVASLTPHVSAIDLAINSQLLTLCKVLNQSCANVATVAMSAGIMFWSLDLLRERGLLRALGILGLLVGLICSAALISGSLRLDVHGMSVVVWLWAPWNVAIAVALCTNRAGASFAAADGIEDRHATH